jgi:hypothetical protein
MKRIFSLLCAANLLCLAAYSQAGSQAGFRQPPVIDPKTGLPVEPKKPDHGPVFELHFKGGTPAELVDALGNAARVRPNVIVQPECKNIVIPPLDLHAVTTWDVFTALNMLSSYSNTGDKNGTWQPSASGDSEIWLLTHPTPSRPMGQAPAFGGFPQFGQAQPAQKVCRVFNLTRYLDTFTVEDITTAIQAAWDLLDLDDKVSIKYHKDTKLLIVAGQENQLLVVSDVLRELAANMPATPKPKTEAGASGEKEKPKTDPAKPAQKSF